MFDIWGTYWSIEHAWSRVTILICQPDQCNLTYSAIIHALNCGVKVMDIYLVGHHKPHCNMLVGTTIDSLIDFLCLCLIVLYFFGPIMVLNCGWVWEGLITRTLPLVWINREEKKKVFVRLPNSYILPVCYWWKFSLGFDIADAKSFL